MNEDGNIYRGNRYITLDQFADSLKNEFDLAMTDRKVMKYAFVIRNKKATVSKQGGKKNKGNMDFTVDTKYNLASVTKTITAVALLQLIEKKHLTIEDKIWRYLPSDWNTINIRDVNFRQVLMHNAGFINDPPDETYKNVKITVENGVDHANVEKHNYKNINYGICRLLVDFLSGYNPAFVANQSKGTSDWFINYLQKNIFDKLGISSVQFKPFLNGDEALFYKYPFSQDNIGCNGDDWTLKPGSAGAVLSMTELSLFLHSLSTDEILLSNNMKSQMNSKITLMGWDAYGDFQGDKLMYKGGFLPPGDVKTAIYKFENSLEISVIFNAPVFEHDDKDYVYIAYQQAWSNSSTL